MLRANLIPQDVQQFILQNIDSIAQLEGLLLLRGEPDRAWDAHTVAQRLYISEGETAELLNQLVERSLLTGSTDPPNTYRYLPESDEVADLVTKLSDLYSKYLVPITHLVHSKPKSRIQEFSDAFRLRKD